MDRSTESSLLVAARAGDEQAFVRLTSPHRRALHVHCYRMLGSLDDADDALQETMLRAWRGLGGFEPRAPLGAWLHRIATNVCLRLAERRARREEPVDAYLQPYPTPTEAGPDAAVELREMIGLAFVAAMQLLPPKQRAVLVLRDALGWPARDVAAALEETVPAVNSALQRARERLGRADDLPARAHDPLDRRREDAVMRRFVEAWEAVDVDAIVELLADDALLTMPPEPMRVAGPRAIGAFFATVPLEGELDRIALVPSRANGQPMLAAYVRERGDDAFRAYGMMVFALAGDAITGITGFAGYPELFPAFGLADRL